VSIKYILYFYISVIFLLPKDLEYSRRYLIILFIMADL
jgi:hypothetical protein